MRGDFKKALLEKHMTRKEFIQTMGASLIVLSGLPNFIQLLGGKKPQPPATKQDVRYAFGARRFGV